MSLAVVFLPDTALLVPGAAGRADPAAGLRDAAVAALADLADDDGRVLVVAPARADRFLPHPVAPGLGAAGLDLPDVGRGPEGAPLADVPASVALVLLRAAGVAAPVDVREIARASDAPGDLPPAAGDPRALVVVGSLSARHGPDAPLADDPRAPDVDAALLTALGEGPAALARALDDLGAAAARDLAVSGWAPWRAALALVPAGAAPAPRALHAEVVAGAQHAVAAWRATAPHAPDARPHAPQHPEEPR